MASRTPLGDATDRILNAPSDRAYKTSRGRATELSPLKNQAGTPRAARHAGPRSHEKVSRDTGANSRAPHASHGKTIASEDATGGKRDSHVSNSSASSGKRKTHIGPWKLGKTLGKGSAARVRLARHHVTHELAAVKILSQASCHMTQAGSLAELDQWDRQREEYHAENHIPLSIEREVAILKLIDHPNIMKLYDIWENRSEIYLVLEFVERGDLFEYINSHGPIPEDETVFYFRQMLSALEYCHSFNICHRDLKPENILLKENGQIKIADFGMAAIQQGPNHMLRTSCGSPHYAAPELVSRRKYRGDKVDVWSLGVILYAMLCARLPFDDPDIPRLLAKATKGVYEMPGWLSHSAQDLIRRMLQVDPKDRISIRKIWKHPLVVKYAHFDRFDENGGQIQSIPKAVQCRPVAPEEVDLQTLRQLKSMWHTFPERELHLKLISPEPNDQKLFYWLLYSYREKQLENYDSTFTHSSSDLHHLRPKTWKTKYTTLEFPSQGGRTASRFTVISNVATDTANETLDTTTDGGGTSHSYDPYKASRNLDHDGAASHAKITVYRNGSVARSTTGATKGRNMRGEAIRSTSVNSRTGRAANTMSTHGKSGSRRSLASIRSGDSANFKRLATARHKRGVDFSHNAAGKRRGFNFAFWRATRDRDAMRFSLEDSDFDESPSPEPSRMFEHPGPFQHGKNLKDDASARHIAPQQSWLARLFRVKPATRYLCFCITRRRARQEIAMLLRDWRKYGIRDVVVDKERNIVFARVGAKNYLNIKEVSFAAEIMTVIEHGKRSQLCIVRLTQERGAASSFHRVVETMDTVFDSRKLLVAEQRRAKMMIKTLNA
ncbi:kinase-like domain-containing protein [Microdochium bolleyi]|uniref:non-specific serine/threonine protein kinase n=1 Tax=Microdochium bolleyi TaxID=196109 RepID=A0A136J9Z9_9PEZI|nr:kinase-like domain-containing protein [Microdochium bolleyi]